MKIFYITEVNLGESGAPPIHIKEINNNLRLLGYDVTLFAPKIGKLKGKINFEIKYLQIINKNIIKSIWYNFILFFVLSYNILKQKPDIIYSRQGIFLITPVLVSKLFFIPYVTELNGPMIEEMRFNKESMINIKIASIIERICYNNAKKVITVTHGIKNYIVNKYKISLDKIVVIENGVNINLFKPKNKKLTRRKIRFKNNYVYVGYIGGLINWQGLNYLIKSVKFVLKKIPHCRFVIVGDGPEKENLYKLIKQEKLEKNIILIDAIKNSKVPDYINSFDICICYPYKFRENKTSPFKIYEYLSCGKPIIVSDIKGLEDTFKELTVVAKPEDSADLADKIIKLLENKKLRKELSKKGKQFILKGHSWKDVTNKIKNILKEIKNENSSK